MKINWRVRFKNPTWLTMFLSLIVGFTFNILKMFDIVPTITENQIMEVISQVLTFIGLIGVLVDPTTVGLSDSERAMGYSEPWQDEPASKEN